MPTVIRQTGVSDALQNLLSVQKIGVAFEAMRNQKVRNQLLQAELDEMPRKLAMQQELVSARTRASTAAARLANTRAEVIDQLADEQEQQLQQQLEAGELGIESGKESLRQQIYENALRGGRASISGLKHEITEEDINAFINSRGIKPDSAQGIEIRNAMESGAAAMIRELQEETIETNQELMRNAAAMAENPVLLSMMTELLGPHNAAVVMANQMREQGFTPSDIAQRNATERKIADDAIDFLNEAEQIIGPLDEARKRHDELSRIEQEEGLNRDQRDIFEALKRFLPLMERAKDLAENPDRFFQNPVTGEPQTGTDPTTVPGVQNALQQSTVVPGGEASTMSPKERFYRLIREIPNLPNDSRLISDDQLRGMRAYIQVTEDQLPLSVMRGMVEAVYAERTPQTAAEGTSELRNEVMAGIADASIKAPRGIGKLADRVNKKLTRTLIPNAPKEKRGSIQVRSSDVKLRPPNRPKKKSEKK